MSNTKLAISVGLAAATLALVLTNVLGGPALLQSAALALVIIITAVALAAAAFAVAWKQRSFVVAGLLAAAGVIQMIPAIIATGYFSVIVFPGPIIRVMFGLVILGLGVAKGVRTAKMAALTV
jgi:hypothetical protein